MIVAPLPILFLALRVKLIERLIGVVFGLQPAAISLIFGVVPHMIVVMYLVMIPRGRLIRLQGDGSQQRGPK